MSEERDDRNGTDRVKSEPREDRSILDRSRSRSLRNHLSRSKSRSRSRNRSRSRSPRGRRSRDRERRRRGRGGGGGGKSSSSDHRMVYISNIPYDVRWMDLKDLVRDKAGDVSFVEMIERQGRSKGCAVVEFKSREAAEKCIDNMHKMKMQDRYLVVKEIRDPDRFFRKVKEETGVDFMASRSGPQSLLSLNVAPTFASTGMPMFETYGLSPTFLRQLGIEGPLCNRVFVANLPYNVTSMKVKEIFQLAGQVTDVELQVDKDGKNKGLAVVEFFHPIEAVQAISMLHVQKYMDRPLTVKMDRFEKSVEPRRPGELPKGLESIGMGLGANGAPLTNIAQLVASGSFGPTVPNPYASSGTTRIGPAFGGGGGGGGASIGYPHQTADPIGQPGSIGGLGGGGGGLHGLAGSDVGRLYTNQSAASLNPLSSFSNSSVLAAAAAATGGGGTGMYRSERELIEPRGVATSGGGYYATSGSTRGNMHSPFSDTNYGNTARDIGGGGGGGYQATMGDSYLSGNRGGGGSTVFNSAAGGDFPPYGRSNSPVGRSSHRLSRAIIIRNLPLDYSWQTLRDRLRGFGDVDFADIIQPGVGKIRFKTAADAEKAAVSLHGITVEGRPIAVDLAMPD